MALVSWAIAGVFLSGIGYPHLYIITGLTVAARRMALKEAAARADEKSEPPKAEPFRVAHAVAPSRLRGLAPRPAHAVPQAAGRHLRSSGTE